MSHIFNQLNEQEIGMVKNAIPHITILIAGADGNIDAKERAWAEKITGIRTYSASDEYRNFYTEVGQDFQQKLDTMIAQYPPETKQRGKLISEELAKLNPILAKLSKKVGAQLYNEFKRFANHVAKSSGGFMGFFTIDAEEAKFVDLPMLNAIVYDEDSEEE